MSKRDKAEAVEDRTVSSQNGTTFGYIVEWRLKPPGERLVGWTGLNVPRKNWGLADYQLEKMARKRTPEGRVPVQPIIPKRDDFELTPHGLTNENTAEAIMACLKTELYAADEFGMIASYVEWRVTMCRLRYDWKVTTEENEHG